MLQPFVRKAGSGPGVVWIWSNASRTQHAFVTDHVHIQGIVVIDLGRARDDGRDREVDLCF